MEFVYEELLNLIILFNSSNWKIYKGQKELLNLIIFINLRGWMIYKGRERIMRIRLNSIFLFGILSRLIFKYERNV